MSVLVDRHARVVLDTSVVGPREAFAFWRDMICATFVRLDAQPVDGPVFAGRIEHVPVGDVELSTVAAGGQDVRRTPSLIRRDGDAFLLASIQVSGEGRVEQDGRVAVLRPGDMALYDSTRPYRLGFDGRFGQLVVQAPKAQLGVSDTRRVTARALSEAGPGRAVGAFFTSWDAALKTDPGQAAVLLPQAVALLSAAVTLAGHAGRVDSAAANVLLRDRVLRFLQANLADSRLDAARTAAGCGVSARTLYRVMGGGGVVGLLRRLRVAHARQLLAADPARPVSAVGAACGFDSESGFYRAFRAVTGQTPGEWRQACRWQERSDAPAGPVRPAGSRAFTVGGI